MVYCVGGHRQKNDSNDFNNNIVELCEKYSNNHPGRATHFLQSTELVLIQNVF